MPDSFDKGQQARELKARSRQFALDVVLLCRGFPRSVDGYVIAKQLIKAATSTAANYRAACRSRSPGEFASTISLVSEEADESNFWLDITVASGLRTGPSVKRLLAESSELTAIFTASRDTAKRNLAQQRGSVVFAVYGILAILAVLAILAM